MKKILKFLIASAFAIMCVGCSNSSDNGDYELMQTLSGILEFNIPKNINEDFLVERVASTNGKVCGVGKFLPNTSCIPGCDFFLCDNNQLIFSFNGDDKGLFKILYDSRDFSAFYDNFKNEHTSTDYIKGNSVGGVTIKSDNYNESKYLKVDNQSKGIGPFNIDLKIKWTYVD